MPAGNLLLLDTNVLLHLIRGNADGLRLDSEYSLRARSDRPLISVITVGEILTFAQRGPWGRPKLQRLHELLSELVIVPIQDHTIPEHYAHITAFSQASGRSMGDNDRWIAATAAASGAELLTTDPDFDPLHPTYVNLASRGPRSTDSR